MSNANEELQFKPDPIARQSDLEVLRARERTEHMKTRAMIAIVAAPGVLKALPWVVGAAHWYLGGLPW